MKIKLPRHGQSRVIKRFAIFPIKIDGYMYWMQFVNLYQVYDVTINKWETKAVFNKKG